MRWRVFLAGELVPDKSVVVGFDDGYLDNWVYAIRCWSNTACMPYCFFTRWLGEGPLRPHAGQGTYTVARLPEPPCQQDGH